MQTNIFFFLILASSSFEITERHYKFTKKEHDDGLKKICIEDIQKNIKDQMKEVLTSIHHSESNTKELKESSITMSPSQNTPQEQNKRPLSLNGPIDAKLTKINGFKVITGYVTLPSQFRKVFFSYWFNT